MGGCLFKLATLSQPPTSGRSLSQPPTAGESLPKPSTAGELLPKPLASGEFLPKFSTSGESLPQPSTSGESLPQPSTLGESLPQPSTSGASLPKPLASGESLPQLSISRESLGQPLTSAEFLGRASTSGEYLPQPSTVGEFWPQPSTSREFLGQPSTSVESWLQPSTSRGFDLQYIRNSKRLCYLIQLNAYSTQLDGYSSQFTTRLPETTAAMALEYLKLATSVLGEAESGLKSKRVQFNHKQLQYLVNKLKLSINSAQDSVRSHSRQQVLECLGSLKLLVRLAIGIKWFIDECSKEKWIQAATMFMDVSMHVASLSYYLEACKVLLSKQSNDKTLQQTLANISKELDSCEKENTRQDQDSLLKKLEEGCIPDAPEYKALAQKLIGRLRTALDGSFASPEYLQNWSVDLDQLKLNRRGFISPGAYVYNSECMGTEVVEKSFDGMIYKRGFVGTVEKEVKHMIWLSHPNIVQILHYAVDEQSCSMVMEKMEGDLETLIKNGLHGKACGTNPFPIDEALDIVLQIAEGMHYIHKNKVVHRDVKPANILYKYVENDPPIGAQLTMKVADFGLSKTKESTINSSIQSFNKGTNRYMAPEVILMRSSTNKYLNMDPFKSDVYSYAMVCYMILTGNEPFSKDSGVEAKRNALAGVRPMLSDNQCPHMLKALIERCWLPDPAARPCFGEICEELRLIKIIVDREIMHLHLSSDCRYQLSVQVNNRQCDYLARKLKVAIQFAQIYFSLEQRNESLGILEFLIRLAADVEIFIRNCCKDKWIVASIMLPNTFEHMASMAHKFELCTQLFRSTAATEVIESLLESMQRDQTALKERLVHSGTSSANDFELASMLQWKLEAASPVLAPNAESSNYDAWRVNSTEWTTDMRVGGGSAGTVFKGEWRGEQVAVKFYEELDLRELSIHAEMCHPNIVQFYCFSATRGGHSIVMELMDEDLQSLMQRKLRDYKTPFTIMQAIDIALQISEAVKYMHQHHVVHRDLKSQNILVKSLKIPTTDIEVVYAKVSDFGISKSSNSTQTYNVGTTRWMAPEVIRMGPRVEEGSSQFAKYPFKVDAFSFGILCFEILTGLLPFHNMEANEARRRVMEGLRPCLPDECPQKFKDLIERCWNQNPKSRPTFLDISEELYELKLFSLQETLEPMDQTIDTREELEALQEELEELKGEPGLSDLYVPYSSLSESRKYLGRGGSYTTIYKVNLDKVDVAQKEFPWNENGKFKRELQILGRLGSHPNIIGLIHYSMNTRLSSIVMELMEEDLRVFIQKRFPFSVNDTIHIILQIAKGMCHIHEHAIVHRDLKSENILIKRDGNGKWLVKVTDFGESTQLQDPCFVKFSMVGTIRWMAPEVMSLEEYNGEIDEDYTSSKIDLYKTDVYSFGMVCYEIMAGKIPFFDISKKPLFEELREVIMQVKQNGQQPVLPEESHPDLKSLVKSCWDRKAYRRPTFATIVEQLSGIQGLLL